MTDGAPARTSIAPIAWRPLAVIATVVAVVLLVLSGRYGYHRDELYFLACGRHLAWGYPDQPPLTPFLARVMDTLGHGSLTVFRLPALLCEVGAVIVTGLLAHELGGRAKAQILAAAAIATGTFPLVSGHILLTSTFDFLVWVTLTWLVVRVLRTDDERLWLVAGAVTGLGLLNKQLPVVLVFAVFVGVLLTPSARHHLRSPWLWAGVVVAAVAWAPVLHWQAVHGWPQLTLAKEIRAEYGATGERIGAAALQLVLVSVGATVLWVSGVFGLWRRPEWVRFRVLAWTWLVVLAVIAFTAGQGYYPAGTYPVLIAAGAVLVERRARLWPWALGAVVATGLLLLPAALPVLPPATLDASPWSGVGEQLRENVGWPALFDDVAAAYSSIPAAARLHAGIFTQNYGEAGAVDRYGPSRGLPSAWSGHNGYGLWGPPPADMTPVVVVAEDGPPQPQFSGCRFFRRITGTVSNEETQEAAVYVCDNVVGGWDAAWPHLRHLSS